MSNLHEMNGQICVNLVKADSHDKSLDLRSLEHALDTDYFTIDKTFNYIDMRL